MQLPQPEQEITRWQEPALHVEPFSPRTRAAILGGSGALAALLVAYAYWQGQFSHYLGAVAVIAGAWALFSQRRQAGQALDILVTTARIVVGRRQYPLAELAGFWLARDGDQLIVTLEHKRPALIPVSFRYATNSADEARTALSPVLAELEPRAGGGLSDQISRYFRI